jgi:hypothetical protein
MAYVPIEGKPVRFPPGRVEIRLNQEHRRDYRTLYGRYQSILGNLPVLRERDLDGRPTRVTPAQLEALNAAFAAFEAPAATGDTVFEAQESARSRLFKRLQYLS